MYCENVVYSKVLNVNSEIQLECIQNINMNERITALNQVQFMNKREIKKCKSYFAVDSEG